MVKSISNLSSVAVAGLDTAKNVFHVHCVDADGLVVVAKALRGHLAEIGVVAAQGAQHAYALKRLLIDGADENGEVVVPDCVRRALAPLVRQIDAIDGEIETIDDEIKVLVKADETARRLMTIPGIGPITASAIIAPIPDMGAFASGREFAAFLGLTPRQNASGGKERLGRITKMGDRYPPKLLVVGARPTLHQPQEPPHAVKGLGGPL